MSIVNKILSEAGGLNESMDLYASGTPQREELDRILDICFFLRRKFFSDFLPGVDDEAMAAAAATVVRRDGITPDGDGSWCEATGTINFYTVDYPKELLPNTMAFIKYILKEYDIEIGDTKVDRPGNNNEVVRIPIVKNDAINDDAEPSVNLSNSNMRMMMCDVLHLDEEFENGRVEAADLLMRLEQIKDLPSSREDENSFTQEQNIYTFKPGNQYVDQTLARFRTLAKWALKRGYRTLNIA